MQGQVTVPAAGTAVQCPDRPAGEYLVKALSGNAGVVYIGDVNVDSTNGYELNSFNGDLVILYLSNLNELWVDADNNDEGVCFIRCTRERSSTDIKSLRSL